jgi:hypothetical protein
MLRQLTPLALYRLTIAAELLTARAIAPIATVLLLRITQIASIFPIFAMCAAIISVPSVRQRRGRRNQKTKAREKHRSGNPSFCVRHENPPSICSTDSQPKGYKKLGAFNARFPCGARRVDSRVVCFLLARVRNIPPATSQALSRFRMSAEQ